MFDTQSANASRSKNPYNKASLIDTLKKSLKTSRNMPQSVRGSVKSMNGSF